MRSLSRPLAGTTILSLLVAFALLLGNATAQPRPRRTPAATVEMPEVQITPPARPSFTPQFSTDDIAATATAFYGGIAVDESAIEATAQALAAQIDLSALEGWTAEDLEAYLADLLGESTVNYDAAAGTMTASVGVTEAQWTEALSLIAVESGLASSAYVDLLADYGARVTLDGIDFQGVSGTMQVLIAVSLVDGLPVVRIDAASFNGRELPAAVIDELNAQIAALNLYDAVVTYLAGISPDAAMPYSYAITALLITDNTSYVTTVIDTGVALPTPAATPAIPRRRG